MRTFLGFLTAAAVLASASVAQAAPEKKAVDFERDIQPILAENCYGCHSAVKAKGGLQLDSLKALLKGGNSGAAIVAGKSQASLLVKKADEDDPTPHKGT